MGIGGEYAAINSAIDELIPAKYRGRVDIAVNGTYWGGAFFGTIVTLVLEHNLPASYSWRVAFLTGPALGLVILFIRKNLPESPRWLLMHGREKEAEKQAKRIEALTKDREEPSAMSMRTRQSRLRPPPTSALLR
jgi:MFS family permease